MSSIIPVLLSTQGALSAATLLSMGGYFDNTVDAMVSRYGTHLDSAGKGPVDRFRADTLEIVQTRFDSEVQADPTLKARFDSFGGEGFFQPRELEHAYVELEEHTPAENAMRLFTVDSSVPLGAREHVVTRSHTQGAAVWYRGGVEVPMAQASRDQESFPVRYVVAGYEEIDFDRFSANFAGKSIATLKNSGAIDAIDRKINAAAWYGDDSAGLKGILNYPYLASSVSAVNYTTGSPDDILADLHAARNWPSENSKQVFSPTAVVTTERVKNKIMQRPRSTTSDMTVGQMFLRDNGSISSFEVAWELDGAGPAGEDGMLFYRNELNSIAIVMVQGPTVMPTQQQGFMHKTFIWAAYGGVIMRDVGNNILHWITI